MCIYTNICKVGTEMWVLIRLYIHALSHFFFGVGFESALDPERPFSVLSIPDEVTRHSLLQGGGGRKTEEVKVKSWQLEELASFQQFEAVTLLIYTQVVVETHFFSSSLARTKRVKFLSNMKPISNAMPPPTHEAMMVASVLSTTLTADSNNKQKGWRWWKHTNSYSRRQRKTDIYISCQRALAAFWAV